MERISTHVILYYVLGRIVGIIIIFHALPERACAIKFLPQVNRRKSYSKRGDRHWSPSRYQRCEVSEDLL